MAQGVIYAARPPRRRGRRARRRRTHRDAQRWRKLTRRAPVVLLAAASFAAGALVASRPNHDEQHLVTRYVTAWTHGDVPAMYRLLDPHARSHLSETAFAAELRADAETATATRMRMVKLLASAHGVIGVRMVVFTRLWGRLHETLRVPLTGSGSGARVALRASVLFPGLRGHERLTRRTELPTRGTLLASDGTPLAQGPDRTSPIPDVAVQIVGTLGPVPATDAARYAALGDPPGTQVGQDGLERIFQNRLAGTVGGRLLAGHRTLAKVKPIAAKPVKTTIDPSLETAAVSSLAGQYAGISVMNPKTGALEALAGIAFSALQPPGSTMKIVTSTAALQAHLVTLDSTFPIETDTTLDGFTLQNAGGEACGGTLINAFAVSCNSVFAPLGVKVGAKRLVATADRFGFNEPSPILGAAESSIPPSSLKDDLDTGSSAIGQGLVQATPLQMADVAATIADGGRRPIPTLLAGQRPRFVHVTTHKVAGEVQQMMEAVVQYGTGVTAQIPGVVVAGKTGTAQIENTPTNGSSAPSKLQNTDAWFVGYAPVRHPVVVAGALFPNAGSGEDAAAPSVRDVIEAALAK